MTIHLTASQAAQITRDNQPAEPTGIEMPVEELRQWRLRKEITGAAYQGYEVAFLEVERDDLVWLEELGFELRLHRQDDEEANYLATRLAEEFDRLGRFTKQLDEKTGFLRTVFNTRTSLPASFLNFLTELFEQHPLGVDSNKFCNGMSKFPLAAHVNFQKYPYLIDEVIQCKRACVDIEEKIATLQSSSIYTPIPIEDGYLVSWKAGSRADPTNDAFTPQKVAWLANDGQAVLDVLLDRVEETALEGKSHVSIFLSQRSGIWRIFKRYDQSPLDELSVPNLVSLKELIESLGYGIAERSFTFATGVGEDNVRNLFYELVVYWQEHKSAE